MKLRHKWDINEELLPDDGKHYNGWEILQNDSHINIVMGERSNGKSYFYIALGLLFYKCTGYGMIYSRREKDAFTSTMTKNLFRPFYETKLIEHIFKDEGWTDTYYFRRKWYLCKYDEMGNMIRDEKPFCIGIAINEQEDYRSVPLGEYRYWLFDEFITKGRYLINEFHEYQDLMSSIIRDRDDVLICLVGNSVNFYNPYFEGWGLVDCIRQEPGLIQEYIFENGYRISVQLTDHKSDKESDVYFTFGNDKRLNMIAKGGFATDIYPHKPVEYTEKNIKYRYYICYLNACFVCEIVKKDNITFTYIYETKNTVNVDGFKLYRFRRKNEIVFCNKTTPDKMIRKNIFVASDNLGKFILQYYKDDLVYYDNDVTGEMIHSYLVNLNKSVI